MRRDTFIEEYLVSVHEHLVELSSTKGLEYAGTDDVLANFMRLSGTLKISPEMVLWVYLTKHLDAIASWVATNETYSTEPIQGRIDDALLYLVLLRVMASPVGRERLPVELSG